MPYRIEEQDGKYCVIKISDGSNTGCSATKAEALAHMRALYANEPHTSAMVALLPSKDHAERLATEYGEDASALHVTLGFLGSSGDWNTEKTAAVHKIVKEVSETKDPFPANAFAAAQFNPDSELAHVMLMGHGTEQLNHMESLRDEIMTKLLGTNQVPRQHAPWVAHMTLGYGDTVTPEEVSSRLGPVNFDRLRVAFGGVNVDYPLTSTTASTITYASNVNQLAVGSEAPQSVPVEDPAEPIPDWSPTAYSWQGPITFEGEWTGDGRFFKPGSVTWQPDSLPLPFSWQKENLPAHEGSVIVGRVDQIFRQGNAIMGRGIVLSGPDAPPEAADFLSLMHQKASGWVSIDGDAVAMEVVDNADPTKPPKRIFDSIRLRGLTAVSIAALIDAKIQLDSMTTTFSLTAAAIPVNPPSGWFANPGLIEPTPITIGPEGQIFGHLALFDVCHIGFPEAKCMMAPRHDSFEYFHTGELLTADGDSIAVGHMTFKTGHASDKLNGVSAAAHYDNTGMVAADVVAGNDKHGIWVAGALRSHLTDADLREFRSAPPSGDWRRIAGRLRLVAALAVNVPGFPNPRARVLVASGETSTLILTASDWRAEVTEADLEARRSLRERLARNILGDTEEYALVASAASLPLADQGRAWDGPGATSRMLNAASDGDKINKAEASRGFFKIDGDGSKKGDYSLPFADIISGTLTAVPRGIFAVAAVLQGSRGASIQGAESIKPAVAAYYHRLKLKAPWEGK